MSQISGQVQRLQVRRTCPNLSELVQWTSSWTSSGSLDKFGSSGQVQKIARLRRVIFSTESIGFRFPT